MPYAEDLNYWKTSQLSSDDWLESTKALIVSFGGKVLREFYGSNEGGSSAFYLRFLIKDQEYQIKWPVLESKTGNNRAAKIQAATAMYHFVKATVLAAEWLSADQVWAGFVLPSGEERDDHV
jgi:hypothetical protein